MSSSVQRAPIAFTTGGGFFVPITAGAAASVSIRPPAILNVTELQVLGFSSDVLSTTVPALAAGATADVPYTYTPAGLPVNFTLVNGAGGIIISDIGIPVLPDDVMLGGISSSLTFGIGPSEPGSPSWTLVAGQQYQTITIGGSIRWYSPGGCAEQTISLFGQTMLLCSPPMVLG